jgi:hypothetical protein
MKSVADRTALRQLVERLNALEPDTPRKWGTLSAGEMLCHLGDATSSVLKRGASESAGPSPTAPQRHPILKWIALRSPLPWPHGLTTPAAVDPHVGGTKAGDFAADRERAIAGLRAVAAAPASSLAASHGAFGSMTIHDWHRWAYRHTDHHLRQFGV